MSWEDAPDVAGGPPEGDVHLRASASGRSRVFQAGRDQYIYGPEVLYSLARWAPANEVSVNQARVQPSRLLRASSAVVDFVGRAAELEELQTWRDDPQLGNLAVRLVYGAGGQGKSRLAAQVASLWKGQGWSILEARAARRRRAVSIPLEADSQDAGLLVTVDYAERWNIGNLLSLVADANAAAKTPVRLLLLARPAGTWWQSLHFQIKHDLDVAADARELGPVEGNPRGRQQLFNSARDRFAQILGVSDPQDIAPPATLEDSDAYRLVLAVHIAALAAVLAHDAGASAPADLAEASVYLLERERDYWETLHGRAERPLSTSPDAMGQVVFIATLTGPLPHTQAVNALHQAEVESSSHPGQILKDHSVCYPPLENIQTGTAFELQPLYPDRLGEDFLALTMPGHGRRGYSTDPWAAAAITRLLIPTERFETHGSNSPPWVRTAMTVLVETARRWPHVAEYYLCPVLRERPRLALEIGGSALAALVGLSGIDIALLEAIEAILPRDRHTDLDTGIAALTRKLTEHRLARTSDRAERAELYLYLGHRLSNAGLYEEALAAIEHALDLHLWLANSNPTVYEPDLARSLSTFAASKSDAGQAEDALGAIEYAVLIYENLTVRDSSYEPYLARSLHILGAVLINLMNVLRKRGIPIFETRERAIAVLMRAVSILERLALSDPSEFEPALAGALSNLGISLIEHWSILGHDQTLDPTERALQINERLAAANPAAFEPSLVHSLTQVSRRLADQKRREEALEAAVKAVEISRRLTLLNPAAFEDLHVDSLIGLCLRQWELGRNEGASAAIQEAIQLLQKLSSVNPSKFRQTQISVQEWAARNNLIP